MPKMATDLFYPNTPEKLANRCIQYIRAQSNGRAHAKLKRYRHSPSPPAKALDLLINQLIKPTHLERTNRSFSLSLATCPPLLSPPIANLAIGETGGVPANRPRRKAYPNPLFSREEGERHHLRPPYEKGTGREHGSGARADRAHKSHTGEIKPRSKTDRALILERVLGAFAVNLENECRNRTNAMCDRSPPPWPTSSLQKQNPPLQPAKEIPKCGRTLWRGARRKPATSPNLMN